jgi:hypothetical protein
MGIIQKMTAYKADLIDVGLIKIAVLAVTLLLAKLWTPLLSLEWYWYLILFIVAAIRPFSTFVKFIKR